jgi:DNA-binding NtrC family response regulator
MSESGSGRWLAVVPVSESFGTTVGALARELALGVVRLELDASEPPEGTVGLVILAGGAETDGLGALEAVARGHPIPCWLVGASPDHRVASAAIRRGAEDYFALPDDLDLLRRTLERAAARYDSERAAGVFAETERRTTGFAAILGRHPGVRAVVEQARRVAAHRDVTVLLGGETGTGKELLARAIHYESPRAAHPFVEVNCAAIPAALLESELFGHEKGAFTGAVRARPGLFELAQGGTLFLDELGHLPLELQPKLLRAVQARQIRRVGGQELVPVDVRVISATHVDLARAVREGTFREDLYYRLNVVTLVLPPLRERGSDIELLAEAFLAELAGRYGLPVPPLTLEMRAALRSFPWPGNVRELRNAIERGLVLSPRGTLLPAEVLPDPPSGPGGRGGRGGRGDRMPFPATLREITRAAALAMLELTGGNKSVAARRLGISRPRLQRILEGEQD